MAAASNTLEDGSDIDSLSVANLKGEITSGFHVALPNKHISKVVLSTFLKSLRGGEAGASSALVILPAHRAVPGSVFPFTVGNSSVVVPKAAILYSWLGSVPGVWTSLDPASGTMPLSTLVVLVASAVSLEATAKGVGLGGTFHCVS